MMTKSITIYHNPRCSKSRETLAIIEKQGITPTIINYLKDPIDHPTLAELINKLGISAYELLRKGEEEYKSRKQDIDQSNRDELISIMVAHPKLIERPIVVNGDKAILGRPPENVLKIL